MSPPIAGNGTDLSTGRAGPVVDFTSADFDSINDDLTTYAQATFSDRWTDFNPNQFAVVFKELIAYVGDQLTYMVNSEIRETFAATVIRRQNLANIGKGLGYTLPGAVSATVSLVLTLNPLSSYPITILRTDQYSTQGSGTSQVNFHPLVDTVVASYPAGGTVTILAAEGTFYEQVLIGVSTGAPNQRWQLPQTGVDPTTLSVVVSASTWTATTNLATSVSTAQVFKIVSTDDGNTFVLFGDGVFGAVPPLNAQITATFNVGGGQRGNQGAGAITVKTAVNSAVLSVTNPAASTGGSDVESMYAARNGILASLSTQQRWVTPLDYQNGISSIAGVANVRASGGPSGSRVIQAWVAPSGGGAPTPALLSTISAVAQPNKMIGNKLRLYPPFYKAVRLNVLLHINSSFRAQDVAPAVRAGVINPQLSGFLDFPQLNFGAVTFDANGNPELLLSQTRLQSYFASLSSSGLDRAEIQQLDVMPVARAPQSGNTGNGSVTNITTTSRQRRRQYFVLLTSASAFTVYERLVGQVTGLTDLVLSDANQIFDNESVPTGTSGYFNGWKLAPDATSSTLVAVTGAAGSYVTTSSLSSLFSLTEIGSNYYLYNPAALTGVVGGAAYTSTDGAVSFQVTAGTSRFVAGDSFIIDVFPLVGDILMAVDEYPQLLDANFVTRTSGGSRA
jgi:hypothetical protein